MEEGIAEETNKAEKTSGYPFVNWYLYPGSAVGRLLLVKSYEVMVTKFTMSDLCEVFLRPDNERLLVYNLDDDMHDPGLFASSN